MNTIFLVIMMVIMVITSNIATITDITMMKKVVWERDMIPSVKICKQHNNDDNQIK